MENEFEDNETEDGYDVGEESEEDGESNPETDEFGRQIVDADEVEAEEPEK
jgi:hypothetical protein